MGSAYFSVSFAENYISIICDISGVSTAVFRRSVVIILTVFFVVSGDSW